MAKPWFRPKMYGYGAGLPIAWEGWAVFAAYGAAIVGYLMLLRHLTLAPTLHRLLMLGGIIGLTIILAIVTRARTAGGWRWRRGPPDLP